MQFERHLYPQLAPQPAEAAQAGAAARLAGRCPACGFRALGLSGEAAPAEAPGLHIRRRLKRGEMLCREGESLEFIYAARHGFFKSVLPLPDGREQVAGFFMTGELMGVDAVADSRHQAGIVALEDSEVCAIPLPPLLDFDGLAQRQICKAMGGELARMHRLLAMLGSMRAEQRLAAFILDLSRRFAERGYSAAEFNLRMTREEIGSYLGLTLQTVSLDMSRFARAGLIAVRHRNLRILDTAGLQRVADGQRLQSA